METQATVILTGNRRIGFTVEVNLPKAFTSLFLWHNGIEILGARLEKPWGERIDAHTMGLSRTYRTHEEARNAYSLAVVQIKEAEEYLAETVDVVESTVVPLEFYGNEVSEN